MTGTDSATGVLLVVDHLVELVAVLALLFLCLLVGRSVGKSVTTGRPDRPLAELMLSLLLGMAVYATAILLLGLVGLLSSWSLGALSAGLIVVVRGQLRPAANLLRRCSGFARSRWDLLALFVLGIVAACLLFQSSTPPTDWDALVYHLEVPEAWLNAGSTHLPGDNLHAAFTGLVHLLFLPLLAVGAPSGTATLSAVLACLLAVLLFEFGDRFFDRLTGRVAAITLFGSPAVLLVAMTPRIDVTLALFLTAGVYSLYATLFDEREGPLSGPQGLYLTGLLLGLATGIKLTALPWLLCVAPLIVWSVIRHAETKRDVLGLLTRSGACFLLGAAPWMVLRWHLVDAPLYPLLSPRYLEPWLRPWYDTLALGQDAYSRFEAAPRFTSDVVSLRALLFEPGSLTPEREGAFYFPSLLFWILPLALLRPRHRRLWLLTGIGVAFIVLIPLLLPRGGRTNLRFLIPALPLLTLAAASLLSWAHERIHSTRLGAALVGAVLAVTMVPATLPFVYRWSEMPTFSYLAGEISAETYRAENEDPDVYLWAPVAAWINETLSEDARVLMLFEGRGYYLDVPKLQDNLMANWPLIANVRKPDDCLERAGVTHVLVNYGVLDKHLGSGMPPEAIDWPSFGRFARECLDRVSVRAPYALYRIERSAPSPAS